jgi:hypothetical protein
MLLMKMRSRMKRRLLLLRLTMKMKGTMQGRT